MPSFSSFVDSRGKNVIREWREGLDKRLQAHVDDVLGMLEKQPRIEWPRKRWDWMKGKGWKGIGEIRFDYGGNKYRIFAFVRADEEVVMIHAGKKITQKNTVAAMAAQMQDRRRAVDGGASVEPYFP